METTNTLKNKQSVSPEELKKLWDKLTSENPRLRTKQAAEKLGVSEVELLASTCDGEQVHRLQGPWDELIKQLETLGYVMALTRNESAVHEKKGIYQNFEMGSHVGLVLDENIDLRLFLKRWHIGFAATVANPRGTLYSLQFFDKHGIAVHKVYLMNEEHRDKYNQLVKDYAHPEQSPMIEVEGGPEAEEELPDEEVDAKAFLVEWAELEDTHDFYPLMKKYGLTRTQALRLGEEEFTRRVPKNSTHKMLKMAAEREVPIMVFVRSPGVIQIHSGPVHKIKKSGNWLNVLDPEFNLHLREDHIKHSWVVQKPTEDGIVTSLEVFDEEGEAIATFFGARKPGKKELSEWRMITQELLKS